VKPERKHNIDLSVERTQLLERDAEWAAAASEGRDIERVLSYWTEDAVVLSPGLPPVIGKAALRQYVLASLQIPGFQINWTSMEVIFSPDRNLAYMFSQNAVTMNGPTAHLPQRRAVRSRSGVESPMGNGVAPSISGMRSLQSDRPTQLRMRSERTDGPPMQPCPEPHSGLILFFVKPHTFLRSEHPS
jgi:ketosteroid isomerase-like protein